MSDQKEEHRVIRRIVIGVDASPYSLAALRAGVNLAAQFGASVTALFVQDTDLLHAASLPVAREVRAFARAPHSLQKDEIRAQFQRMAERARRELEELARAQRIEHSFQTIEGRVAEALISAAREADLLAVGKASKRSSRRKLGTTALHVLRDAPTSVLVLGELAAPEKRVVVYDDGSEAAERAIDLAAQIAQQSRNSLSVLLSSKDADVQREREEWLQRTYGSAVSNLKIRPLRPAEMVYIGSAVYSESAGLFVTPATGLPSEPGQVRKVMYEANAPVLVVR